jgi:pimeloyl-ACP methyl ester carboxylesterase
VTPPPVLIRQRTSGPGPRVLLLHGMADSGAVWDQLCALVPHWDGLRGAEFFSAELPWRGTGPPDWAHRTDTTSWVAETLDLLAADAGPADIVVAHSFSAMLLLDLLCGQSAATCRGIVLVSPFFRPRPADFDWDTMTGLSDQFLRTMEEGIRVAAGSRGKPGLHQAMARWLCEAIGPYGWSRFLELYLRTPWLSTENLRTPTFVVSGAEDRIAVTAEAAALVERLPTATLRTVEDAGHFPMVERPAVFADLLDEFLTTARTEQPLVEQN